MKNKIIHILIAVFLINGGSIAQESLNTLEFNPEIQKISRLKSNYKSKVRKNGQQGIISLPFVDDFAKEIGFPDDSLWMDEKAYINLSYPDSMISLGVATLDAISGTGAIYNNAGSRPFGADTLTSRYIHLNYPGDNTIFFSFYYQPGGLGDAPDSGDTLALDFFMSGSNQWKRVWTTNFHESDSLLIENNIIGNTIDTIKGNSSKNLRRLFHQVILPVNQAEFLTDSFQFRFCNYASLSSLADNESRSSNADHWNLDFVILDRNRNINDTIIEDVAIIKQQESLLKNFESIPWHHYIYARDTELKNALPMLNRNLGSSNERPPRAFIINDLYGHTEPFVTSETTISEMAPFSTQYYEKPFNTPFAYYPDLDSNVYEIIGYTSTDATLENLSYRWNDTTRFYQKFFNYYAYDDGSSENGYGLIGEGTERAMVAMRFKTFVEDTLVGVQIYFNQTSNNANHFDYKIHVWDDNNGVPGNILYTLEEQRPQSTDSLNKFTIIPFDKKLIVSGTFYIGWQKVYSQEMLNVGFDVNKVNNDKLFYNFENRWMNSLYEGTIMMRPMFGKKVIVNSVDQPAEKKKIEYSVYPNPADKELNIVVESKDMNFTYTIFDLQGRVLLSNRNPESAINISDLKAGIYFIRISTQDRLAVTKKFIITH
ncbi:MAG: T9SS type A sorting domain-containing protein [Bacteroidales bacterium]|nr:T9SS type A sorting domain-containing protein [Bacteroidales bacterium]